MRMLVGGWCFPSNRQVGVRNQENSQAYLPGEQQGGPQKFLEFPGASSGDTDILKR